jgi:hypothetical protein
MKGYQKCMMIILPNGEINEIVAPTIIPEIK